LYLLAANGARDLAALERALPAWIDESLAGMRFVRANASVLLDGLEDQESKKDAFSGLYFDHIDNEVIVIISPSCERGGGPVFLPPIPVSLVQERLSAVIREACRNAVRRNAFACIPGVSPAYQDEAIRFALGRSPVNYWEVAALMDKGVEESKLSDLVRICATRIRHKPEADDQEIIDDAVTTWIEEEGLGVPKVLTICIGSIEGGQADYLGLIADQFEFARKEYMRLPLGIAFSDTRVGRRAAVVAVE
jgi:hypothetical protein